MLLGVTVAGRLLDRNACGHRFDDFCELSDLSGLGGHGPFCAVAFDLSDRIVIDLN
jgi:hypothetical protein